MRLGFGRGLLASSHAGTRLPIAVLWTRTQGAPPLSAPGLAGASAVLHILSEKSRQKTGLPMGSPAYAVV